HFGDRYEQAVRLVPAGQRAGRLRRYGGDVRHRPRRRRRDDGPRAADSAGRRTQPAATADGGGDGPRVPTVTVGGRQEAAVEPAGRHQPGEARLAEAVLQGGRAGYGRKRLPANRRGDNGAHYV